MSTATTTTTSPFKDLAASLEAGWAARPSLLEFVGNIPDSVAALRMRWYEVFRSIYVDFIREINHWALSEEEAEAIVDERVGSRVNDCSAPCIDSFHLHSYLCLQERYEEAALFEFPDSRQYVGGPYDAMETA